MFVKNLDKEVSCVYERYADTC